LKQILRERVDRARLPRKEENNIMYYGSLASMLTAILTISNTVHGFQSHPQSQLRSPASPTLHCIDAALDTGEVQNAYWDMKNQKADAKGRVWLEGKTSAFGYNGKTQFYICNNAYKKRYFTVDQPQLDSVKNYQNACGGNGFWVMNDDKWSYGIDQSGAAECGF